MFNVYSDNAFRPKMHKFSDSGFRLSTSGSDLDKKTNATLMNFCIHRNKIVGFNWCTFFLLVLKR